MTELADLVDRIEVLSLIRRPERRQRTLARLAELELGLRVEVHDAIAMSPGWRGCRASHMALWQMAVDQDRTIMVMEDDVAFVPEFRTRCARVLEDLPQDWDVLFLGGYERDRTAKVTEHVAQSRSVLWTHAYLARPAALERSLAVAARLDVQIDRAWAACMPGMAVYRATPWLVGQEDGWSDTGDAPAVGRNVVPMNDPEEAQCPAPLVSA